MSFRVRTAWCSITRVIVTINGNDREPMRKNKSGIFPLVAMVFHVKDNASEGCECCQARRRKLHADRRSTAVSNTAGRKILCEARKKTTSQSNKS